MTTTDRLKKLTPAILAEIADEHVRLYTRRVELGKAGNRQIRIDECESYLRIWKSIAGRATVGSLSGFSPEEHTEIGDALDSGEWDDLFEPKAAETSP